MELTAFLELVSTGLAGVIAWWLIDHVHWFAGLQPDTKRYVAWVFTAIIACLGWLGLIAIGARSAPAGAVEWISQLFFIGTSAFGLATILNGASLKKYRTDTN